jgi:hypothetical protein
MNITKGLVFQKDIPKLIKSRESLQEGMRVGGT